MFSASLVDWSPSVCSGTGTTGEKCGDRFRGVVVCHSIWGCCLAFSVVCFDSDQALAQPGCYQIRQVEMEFIDEIMQSIFSK